MKGCLLAPFRLLGCLVLVLLLAGAWFYRDRLGEWGRQLWRRAQHQSTAVSETGRPSAAALERGRKKLALLGAGRDSVRLLPDEVASLLSDAFLPYARGTFDSITVQLAERRVTVHAMANTARLPAGLLGPMGMALRDREPVSAEGPLMVTVPGRGAWRIERLSFRDFPLPSEMGPKLMDRVTGDSTPAVPVRLPAGARAVTVHADGVVFYARSS